MEKVIWLLEESRRAMKRFDELDLEEAVADEIQRIEIALELLKSTE